MTINDEPESDIKKNPKGFDISTQEKVVIVLALIFFFFFMGVLLGRFGLAGGC